MEPKSFTWQTSDHVKLVGQSWKISKKEKAVIVLVHGLGEHCLRYQHLADFFNNAGISVISFDLRGHGQSEGVRGHVASYDAVCDDIEFVIEKSRKDSPKIPIFLYGHSLGGELVLYYLLKRKPELKGAIVTAPLLIPGASVPPWKMVMAKIMDRIAPTFTLPNGLDRSGLSRDPEVEKKYSSDPLVHDMVSARLGMELLNKGQYILDHAKELKTPLLIMQGSADRLVDVPKTLEFSQKANHSSTLKIWDGHYHELHNEPDKLDVMKFELNWLNKQL
jgi:alpha-beta hydrolase superfamily lysophospholipase